MLFSGDQGHPGSAAFLSRIGIQTWEGHGMTESTGLSFIHMGDDIKLGTEGKPIRKTSRSPNF